MARGLGHRVACREYTVHRPGAPRGTAAGGAPHVGAIPGPPSFEEPLLARSPWLVAILLATAATPAAVILAVPAPSPLDAILAWPLVLVDRWVGGEIGTTRGPGGAGVGVRLGALLVGIVLTWLHYVLVARVVVWRLAGRPAGRAGAD